jgi:FkbM family methyltransferase
MIAEWLDQNLNPFIGKLFGFRVVRSYPKLEEVRNDLIKNLDIKTAFDGGANQGQWASRLRKNNPQIKIISYEPVKQAFNKLVENSKNDPNWVVHNLALGMQSGIAKINLANNDFMSSSILTPTDHLSSFPTVEFSDYEEITVVRLDSMTDALESNCSLLKLDVQGFEFEALNGAGNLLENVALIELETAFRPMYKGEMSHSQILRWLEARNFEVYSISQPSVDQAGRVGYVDCLLINSRFL